MNNKIKKSKKVGFLIFSISTAIFFIACSTLNEEKKKPNILVILCDDLGYNDVGFNGSSDITTPNLDLLASNGVKFTNAYVVHPFCGPSRAGFMTGRYPHTFGSQFNLPANSEIIGKGIEKSETFLSKALKNGGYNTGLIGKWHLGAVDGYHPHDRGFDEFYGFLGGGHKYFPEEYNALYKRQKDNGVDPIFEYLWPLEHNKKDVISTEYLTDELSHEAINFIQQERDDNQPFFLYLSYNAPHVPLEAKKEDLAKFASIEDEDRRTYAAMVYAVDRGVGEIIESLKSTGQLENTLIVFFSDNGGNIEHGARNYPLKGTKGDTYEGGFRVPMFMHWPEKLASGVEYTHTVSALDLYPTFCAVGNVDIPEGKVLNGKNILPEVISNSDVRKDEELFVMRHREGYTDVGVIKNNLKAVKAYQNKWSLYDISKDLGEEHDLKSEYPQELEDMVKAAKKWSETHSTPRWYNPIIIEQLWADSSMGTFKTTFTIEKD